MNLRHTICIILIVLSFLPAPSFSQQSDTLLCNNRALITSAALGTTYAISMTGLYALWYKGYGHSGFHFFNDNAEWFQMDKTGHFGSACYLSSLGTALYRNAGLSEKKATITGSAASLLFLSTIEVFDGFSDNWGFSGGDMIANTGGTLLFAAQNLAWHEQRVVFKFSYHETKYASLRQDQLGSNFTERLFKDYNGQTYWLSTNLRSFMKSTSRFPKWINVAVGYSADGLTGARANPDYTPGYIERRRQFFIAPDIDLTKLGSRKKFIKGLLTAFGFIKFPAPAIEFRDNGDIRAHWLYF